MLAGAGVLVLCAGVLEVPKRLVDDVGAGVLVSFAGVEAPKRLVDGAGVAAASGFGVVDPKLKGLAAGGSAAGVVAPKLNMFFCGVVGAGVVSLFCAPAPNPNMLLEAGAAAGCEAPNPPNMLLGAGVLGFSAADELGVPKVNG